MLQALRRPIVALLATLLAAGALAGCSGSSKPRFNYGGADAKGDLNSPPAQIETVRIGYLPLPDALPLWRAQQANYWSQAGVLVELVARESENELQMGLADGSLDGALIDLVQAVGLKAGGYDVQVTGVALGHTPKEGAIQIVSMDATIRQATDLKNVPIEVTPGTAEHYAVDQMLRAAGLTTEEIKLVNSTSADARTRALLTRQIPVGALPEKYGYIATGRGGHLVISDTQASTSLSQTVYVFRTDRLAAKADAITRFFRGYNYAVADTMLKSPGLNTLLQGNAKLAAEEATLYPLPEFQGAKVPTKESVEAIGQWLVEKKLITAAPSYDSLVNASVLPPIK